MTVEEAIALIEQLLQQGRLTKVQEIVLRQSWAGQTYSEMAVESGYDCGYIKDVGSVALSSFRRKSYQKSSKTMSKSFCLYI
jgi:hypothetical protein